MLLSDFLPVWKELAPADRSFLENESMPRHVEKNCLVHDGSDQCEGLLCVVSGRLRAFISSDEGREVTIYRLFERDICLFSASCILSGVQFAVSVEAEQDTDLLVIPSAAYKKVMEKSAPLANYTNQIITSRFNDVVWLIEQILWKSFDRRLSSFLLEESTAEDSDHLKITHEKIADHLGTAREVVTRMLRYFQSEGWVSLSRNCILLTDKEKLTSISS
jgi:CRP/FNR family transcriptional regulator